MSFEEAQTVFYDDNALLIADTENSQDEDRFIIWDIAVMRSYLSSVITIAPMKPSYALSRQAKRQKTNRINITEVRNKSGIRFSNALRNPYTGKLKQQITINIDADTIAYFKAMSERSGIPYQTLINMYLTDCAAKNKQISISWQ